LVETTPLVLGILGSPRARSNTGVLLARVLAGAQGAGARSQLVNLRELSYTSCRHCGGCERTGRCVVRDDATIIYETVLAAQHLVLASPIHFAGVSAEMKTMIDRGQCCWVATYRLKRPVSTVRGERRGVFVATCGGSDTRVFEYAKPTVRAFLNSTGFRYWGELFEADTDHTPPVSGRANLLARAEELGRSLLESHP
jgi:multimeric flavodoxin WrbA